MAVKMLDSQYIVMSNTLAKYLHHDMTKFQEDFMFYLLTMIKPESSVDDCFKFNLHDALIQNGIPKNGRNYNDIRDTLKHLRDTSYWIYIAPKIKRTVSFLNMVDMNEETGEISFWFHDSIKDHLFALKSNYVQFRRGITRSFDSRYTYDLHEILLSIAKNKKIELKQDIEIKYNVEELNERLNSPYTRWIDIKRRVIEVALEEINKYSDEIRVNYVIEKVGNRVENIIFVVRPVIEKSEEFFNARKAVRDKLYEKDLRAEKSRK